SQMRAVLSPDAVTMRDPSGLKAADVTNSSWRRRAGVALAVAAFQMRAVLSSDAVTMRDPAGLKAADVKNSSWTPGRAVDRGEGVQSRWRSMRPRCGRSCPVMP